MFGALNRFIARLDAAPEDQNSNGLHGASGFQVLRNTNPEVPLEPWFDFIIGINGRTIDNPDPNLFATEVRNCAGTTISLGVFSAKGQKIREIYIPIPSTSPTLNLSLQWTPLSIAEDVWHILDVIPNSPADAAGLLPYGDYVIGSPEGIVRGESGLGELVEDFLNRPLRLLVYNHEYNVLRPLTLTPSRSWGGEGALGCVLGYGALHRIPAPLEEGPPPAPGEALFASSARPSMDEKGAAASVSFDEKRGAGAGAGAYGAPPPAIPTAAELFVPANMPLTSPGSGSATSPPPASTSPAPGAGAAKRAKPRAHHHHHHHHAHAPPAAAVGGLDDYFREGEAKSLEEDYVPKKKEGGVPPPPRAGGPPKGGPPRSGTGTPAAGGEGEKEGAEA